MGLLSRIFRLDQIGSFGYDHDVKMQFPCFAFSLAPVPKLALTCQIKNSSLFVCSSAPAANPFLLLLHYAVQSILHHKGDNLFLFCAATHALPSQLPARPPQLSVNTRSHHGSRRKPHFALGILALGVLSLVWSLTRIFPH